MYRVFSAGGNRTFKIFGIGITDACPHIFGGGMYDHRGLDERMYRRFFKEKRIFEGSVFVVHDGYAGTGCTVGSNGRYAEYRFFCHFSQCLGRIGGFSSTDGKNHVRFLHSLILQKSFYILVSSFAAVPDEIQKGQGRAFYRFQKKLSYCCHGLVAAHRNDLCSVGCTHFRNFFVHIRSDGIARQINTVVFHFYSFPTERVFIV